METRLICSPSPSPFPFPFPSRPHLTPPIPRDLRQLSVLCSTVSPNNNSQGSSSSSSNGGSKETKPLTSLNIRYRARSRRQQAKQEKQKREAEEGLQRGEPKPSKKKWEEMRLSEKALDLYLGEQGILFWLNKLAYASIFGVIGGWILFRFVGPSLGLYQLDSPPLSPTSIFNDG